MRCSSGSCHRRNHHVLPAVWFMAGFSRALPSVAMRMLVVNELRVEPEQQAILGVWGTSGFDPNPKPNAKAQPALSPILTLPSPGTLPWNFKMVAAFLSDTVPILGRRRVPYLAIGLCLQLAAYLVLAEGVRASSWMTNMLLGLLDFVQACARMSDTYA